MASLLFYDEKGRSLLFVLELANLTLLDNLGDWTSVCLWGCLEGLFFCLPLEKVSYIHETALFSIISTKGMRYRKSLCLNQIKLVNPDAQELTAKRRWFNSFTGRASRYDPRVS